MAADLGRLNMLPASQSPEPECAPGFPSDAMQIDRERTPTGSPTQSSPGEAGGAAGGLAYEWQGRLNQSCSQAPLLHHGPLCGGKEDVVGRQQGKASAVSPPYSSARAGKECTHELLAGMKAVPQSWPCTAPRSGAWQACTPPATAWSLNTCLSGVPHLCCSTL